MSRRDFWICIAIILTIFTLGVMVGMCVQVLGVPAHACAEAREIEGGYQSGMPCENKEQFERWYENYEQETIEEVTSERTESTERIDAECVPFQQTEEVQMETEVQCTQTNIWTINGELIDPDIQRKLYSYLEAEKIEYWYTGALCQMYQESRGQKYAENPNGLDKGIYQYRITYWNWDDGDIFSVDAQIQRYAREMAARFNAGLTVDEAISRHNTSDHVTIVNWEYVGQVKQWLNTIQKIEF